jgi:hypothetical protein
MVRLQLVALPSLHVAQHIHLLLAKSDSGGDMAVVGGAWVGGGVEAVGRERGVPATPAGAGNLCACSVMSAPFGGSVLHMGWIVVQMHASCAPLKAAQSLLHVRMWLW